MSANPTTTTTTTNPSGRRSLESSNANSFTQSIKSLSQGVWIAKSNRIRVDKLRGKFIHHMGYLASISKNELKTTSEKHKHEKREKSSSKYDFLYPEEALLLIENSNLVVYLSMRENTLRVPTSIQQCYEIFFAKQQNPTRRQSHENSNDTDNEDPAPFQLDLSCFKIYSSLVKSGFIVRRAAVVAAAAAKPHPHTTNRANKLTKSKSRSSDNEMSGAIKPIVEKTEHDRLAQSDIYKRLDRVVTNVTLDDLKLRLSANNNNNNNNNNGESDTLALNNENSSSCHVLFEVNQPDKRFQKSKPPAPEFEVFVAKSQDDEKSTTMTVPGLGDFLTNSERSRKQQRAVVDGEDRDQKQKQQIYAFTDEANHPIFYSFDFGFSFPSIYDLGSKH